MKRLKELFNHLQLLGISLIVIGMPLGIIFMSLGGIILVCAWILSGDLKKKFRAFIDNKYAVGISSIYVLYLLGCIYSVDSEAAIRELKNALPLLFFPVVFSSTNQVKSKTLDWLLHLFVLAVLVNSLFSFAHYLSNTNMDYRNIVRFSSHIRLSLMIVLAVHVLGYYCLKTGWLYRGIAAIIVAWLIYFLNVIESATGLFILAVSFMATGFYLLLNSEKSVVKSIAIFGFLGLFMLAIGFLFSSYNTYFDVEKIDVDTLDKTTINGNEYLVLENLGTLENGNYVWNYYCPDEMVSAWRDVSATESISTQMDDEYLYGVLVRYLTSKGLRKDSVGVYSLTQDDLKNIAQGVTNYKLPQQSGIKRRLSELFFEIDQFKNGSNPSATSLISRLYYWKAGLHLIKENPIIGSGTGSLSKKLSESYEKIDSPLNDNARLLIHNQYLTFLVQFGIIGLIWILFVLFRPVFDSNGLLYLPFIFLFIFSLSCISEDTLNTQAGLTFFILFYSLFFLVKTKFPVKNN